MTLYLVRHGKAGDRASWSGSDDLRPLSKAGRRQGAALVDHLRDAGITHVVSSPSVRCRQTVEPLAEALRLPVDLSDALAEGAPLTGALRLVEKLMDEQAVLCTHGDVVGELLEHFRRNGVALDDDRMEKGSTWVLDVDSGQVARARYLAPPTERS
jgi:broad specificity phosphatase PhoE